MQTNDLSNTTIDLLMLSIVKEICLKQICLKQICMMIVNNIDDVFI